MKFPTFSLPSLMGLFWRIEASQVNLFSIMASLSTPFVGASTLSTYSFRKSSGSSISISVSRIVPDVLGVSANSEILKSVVGRVPVDVVYNHSLFRKDSVQGQYDSVHHHLVMRDTKVGVNANVGNPLRGSLVVDTTSLGSSPSGVGSLPELIGYEVVSGSVLPEKFTGFWFVAKRLLKKFKGRQFFGRMHNQLFGYVFGASGGQIPSAPSFYNITAVNQL